MTDLDLIIKGVNNSKTFETFNDREKIEIAKTAIIQDFSSGEHIFTIRHKDSYFFLVYSGILSLRLKTRKIKEYHQGEIFGEVSIFTNEYRLGNIKAIEDSTLIAFDLNKIFDVEFVQIETQLKLLRKLTEMIIGYFYEDKRLPTKTIIAKGESEASEFKRAMNVKEREFKQKLVKTLAAFMNLNGGTILIGVEDDGKIVGIRNKNQTIDKFIRSILDVVDYRLGDYASTLIEFDVHEVDGKKILRIDCDKSTSPIFYRGKQEEEEFIIRTMTRNKVLVKTSDIVKYYHEKFSA